MDYGHPSQVNSQTPFFTEHDGDFEGASDLDPSKDGHNLAADNLNLDNWLPNHNDDKPDRRNLGGQVMRHAERSSEALGEITTISGEEPTVPDARLDVASPSESMPASKTADVPSTIKTTNILNAAGIAAVDHAAQKLKKTGNAAEAYDEFRELNYANLKSIGREVAA